MDLVILICASLALLALCLCLVLMKAVQRLTARVNELQQLLKQHKTAAATPDFAVSLGQAERLGARVAAAPAVQSDRYRQVTVLAQQGLDAEQIAARTQLPASEIEQLLQLARLRHLAQGAS